MKRFILLLITPLLFSACRHVQPKKSKLHDVDHIAVAAVFDHSLTTVINGKESALEVKDWPTNQIISQEIIASLKAQNKNTFELVTDPSIIKSGKDEALGLKNIYLGNRYQALERYLNTEAEKQGAHYLLVIHPVSDPNFQTYKAGYGFFCHSDKGTKGDLHGYFLLEAELWNVKTKDVVAKVPLTPADLRFNTGKNCTEIAKVPPQKWVNLYKNELLALAKKPGSLILDRAGF